MAFGKTKDSLENIGGLGSVPVESALGVFLDLSDDLGGKLHKLPVQNSEAFIKNLRRCNRILLDIMHTNDIASLGASAVEKLQKQNESLDELEQELRLQEASISHAEGTYDARKAELLKKQEELKQSASGAQNEVKALEAQVSALENEISGSILRKSELQTKIMELGRQIEQARSDTKAKEEKKAELESLCKEAVEKLDKLTQSVDRLSMEYENKLKPALDEKGLTELSLKNKCEQYSADLARVNSKNEELSAELELTKLNLKEAEEKQAELYSRISENKKRAGELADEVKALNESVEKDDEGSLVREFENKKEKLIEAQKHCESLKLEIKDLEARAFDTRTETDKLNEELIEKQKIEHELTERRNDAENTLTLLKSRQYEFIQKQETLAELQKISQQLESDSAVFTKQHAGEKGFSLDNSLAMSLQYADGVMKSVRKCIEDYIKTANKLK